MSDEPVVPVFINAPTRAEYVTCEIHEHRAPTDASVKLLREMEKAALDNVERSIAIGGNGFECTVVVNRDMMNDALRADALFKLNGKQMKATALCRSWEKPEESLMVALRDEVAKVIATELLMASWPQLGDMRMHRK